MLVNNIYNNHREELKDPYYVNECLPEVRRSCETLVRVEDVEHTEEECTICKQGYTMEVVDYTDTECVTTYRDSCSWGGDPNRVWSRDVKSYFSNNLLATKNLLLWEICPQF